MTIKPTIALFLLLLPGFGSATAFPSGGEADSSHARESPIIEPFPILSYDTDAGFGYGAKGFFFNFGQLF